jgi:hypothetical protein
MLTRSHLLSVGIMVAATSAAASINLTAVIVGLIIALAAAAAGAVVYRSKSNQGLADKQSQAIEAQDSTIGNLRAERADLLRDKADLEMDKRALYDQLAAKEKEIVRLNEQVTQAAKVELLRTDVTKRLDQIAAKVGLIP